MNDTNNIIMRGAKMCIDRRNCERVFEEIRVLREFCRVTTASERAVVNMGASGEMNCREAGKVMERCFEERSRVGGDITRLIWKLCPDCRGIFYGASTMKRKEM
jgi:hypothetical protein